jgi:signal transduction histidine kinase
MRNTRKLVVLEPDRHLGQEILNILAAADLHLEMSLASSPTQAGARLDERPADLLLCDPAGEPETIEPLLDRAARECGAIIVVEPGLEEWLGAWVERRHMDYLIKAGDFVRLLPALVRKQMARRELETRLAEMDRLVATARELTSTVRHELNNPLTGILGNAELMLQHRRGLSQENIQRLEAIVELVVRMRQYLKELHFGLEAAAKAAASPERR